MAFFLTHFKRQEAPVKKEHVDPNKKLEVSLIDPSIDMAEKG